MVFEFQIQNKKKNTKKFCFSFLPAYVKIIHTDYQVAVVYECQQVGPDNKCKKGQEFVDVLSRSAHGSTAEKLHELKDYFNNACIQEDNMELSSHQGTPEPFFAASQSVLNPCSALSPSKHRRDCILKIYLQLTVLSAKM